MILDCSKDISFYLFICLYMLRCFTFQYKRALAPLPYFILYLETYITFKFTLKLPNID